MTDTGTTDVFKFVAVRPPQLVTLEDTHVTMIRDVRAADRDGERMLASLAGELARPEVALGRWRDLDRSALAPLVDGYPTIVGHYEELRERESQVENGNATEPPAGKGRGRPAAGGRAANIRPGTREVLDESNAAEAVADPQVLRLAWEALYVADSTGADAGARLEGPMAALRVLHFAALFKDEAPAPAAALAALRATPAIPQSFYEARVVTAAPPRAAQTTSSHSETQPEESERSTALRELAQELTMTERLLGLVTKAPASALASSAIESGPTSSEGGWYRSEFRVHSRPALRAAITGQVSRDEASLLDRLRVDESAPIPAAAETLQAHLADLSAEAFALGPDEEFQGYLRSLRLPALTRSGPLGKVIGFDRPVGVLGFVEDDAEFAKDVNVAGRITPLGIGDLKVVKQTLLGYAPGEVAHIENVLKGESKERKHRKLDRTETTLFTSEEETRDTERDTQSTDRFELKREAEQTIKEDMSLKAGLNVTATYGPIVATATGDFAYSTSKEDSQKSSSNFAREVVDRSVSKVQVKTKTERTTKTLNEVEEINTHGVINTEAGGDHVIGVYRWVDKRYRAQIYNYGVRLLLEFVVPEPAEFFRAASRRRAPLPENLREPEPFLNLKGTPLTVADITETDYDKYASRYNAPGVTPPPATYAYVAASITKDGLDKGKTASIEKTFAVPEGYTLIEGSATASVLWVNHAKFSVQMGGWFWKILDQPSKDGSPNMTNMLWGDPVKVSPISGVYPLSVVAYDVVAFAVNVQGTCKVTEVHRKKWQLQTFDKIYAAYQALQTAYDQKVTQLEAAAGIAVEGRNPGTNRVIEKTELKKLCITMMTGQHYSSFDAITEPPPSSKRSGEVDVLEALNEGPIVQFFEQAFEWEQMTYLYYPYFWGRKKNWTDVSRLADPDPLFEEFLRAGAARVVVPVPIAYKSAVEFLLQSKAGLGQKVWGGGGRPTIDTPLYRSITEEMRDQTDDLQGATPEGTPWEFTLPTTLVWLQKGPELPVFVQ